MNLTNQLAERLILAIKSSKPYDLISNELSKLPTLQLFTDLNNNNRKKAFWINIYNSFFQILRKHYGLSKPDVFRKKLIHIAGFSFSLDDIEHGILRKYRYKFSLGYLPNPFAPSIIKKLAVTEIDYRIHFALNCGAKSCPPIAFYHYKNLDSQLEMATLSYLESETEVLADVKVIQISKLFQWFKGDFGGNRGIRNIFKNKLNLDTKGFTLTYNTYNWEEVLDHYVEESFKMEK